MSGEGLRMKIVVLSKETDSWSIEGTVGQHGVRRRRTLA